MKQLLWRLVWTVAVMFGSLVGGAHPKAMIIFDASGSMWGQIEGVNKIVIARDALKSVVQKWNPKVELGLTVYGHRVKGDCNDIQTVIPIGRVNKKKMIDTVYGIMPKGMTPIAKSLRQVANTFRQYEGQTTIILISDGRESCEEDPCATAKQLKAEGINFVAHVVGFNVDTSTDKQLACVAKATGGEYFSAKNAAALNKAIKVIAKKVAKPKPKPKPIVLKNTTLELIARYQMSPTGLNVSGMQWEVTQGGKALYSGSEESPKIPAKVGKVDIKATYNRTSEVQKVEGDITLKAKKNNPVTIQLKSGKVTIDTAEEQEGPRVKASVHIYPILDGDPNLDDEIAWCVPTKTKSCQKILPIGAFFIKATYNGIKMQKQFTLENKEKKVLHLYFKQTSQIVTSASETDGGKWVDASHAVYIPDEEGQPDSHVCSPTSYKKSVGKCKLPVGKYVVKSRYNEYTKLTPIEIKAGETLKLHVIFGSTGQIETTASETDGGKWVDASHAVYTPDEEGQPDSHVCSPTSYKKSVGKCKLPVGKYVVKSRYNEYIKLTPIEIKAGETLKLHVIFGSTGQIETTASETDGGKWVDASHAVYIPDEEGQPDSHVCSPTSYKKSVGKCKLPVGKYVVKSRYNEYIKLTPIEIKAGETLKLHVIFGSTGQIETTASETDGGKWVDASHAVYIPDEEGQPDSHVCSPTSYKKSVGKCKLPVGKYVVKSRYNEYTKLTPIEIKAGETLKLHVIFERFRIVTKCIDMGAKVHYEVYAHNGRMVQESDQICSKLLKLTLDAGDYTVEASIGSDKKEEKFTVGGGSSSLTIDMTTIKKEPSKKEPSKEELIKADEQTLQPENSKKTPTKDLKKAAEGLEQLGVIFGQMGKSAEGDNAKELKEAGQFLEALGGLMGGVKKEKIAVQKKKTIEKKSAQEAQNKEADKAFEKAGDDLKMFTD